MNYFIESLSYAVLGFLSGYGLLRALKKVRAPNVFK